MKFRILALAATGIALFAGSALAQAPASPPANPLDAIPDAMPFSQPYGAPINAADAQQLIAAAAAEAKKHGWAMNIAVVDWVNLVAFERMDGAQLVRSPSRSTRRAPPRSSAARPRCGKTASRRWASTM